MGIRETAFSFRVPLASKAPPFVDVSTLFLPLLTVSIVKDLGNRKQAVSDG